MSVALEGTLVFPSLTSNGRPDNRSIFIQYTIPVCIQNIFVDDNVCRQDCVCCRVLCNLSGTH